MATARKNNTVSEEELEKVFGKENPPTQARSSRKMVAVTRPRMIAFDEIGTVAAGMLQEITEGETQFGTAEFLQLITEDDEKISVCKSSALALYDWDKLIGKYIEITYTGDEKSKKNKGKTFKNFYIQAEE